MSGVTILGFTKVSHFQMAWNLGPALKVDGILGPQTSAAVKASIGRLRNGLPSISAHFGVAPFKCHCGGKLKGCQTVLIGRPLLESLEKVRSVYGQFDIVDGYRCPLHNKAVGGAGQSQHETGYAADLSGTDLSIGQLMHRGFFSGIGYKADSGRVTHVDRRDVSGMNPTHSSLQHPATWTYPGR